MGKDLNKAQFTGHLGADPEMRYTASGSAVTSFRVASNRTWKDRDGIAHEEAEWFRVVAWDKLGEICNQYLGKGTRVYIEGRLQTRKWTDKDGIERYATEVVAQDMIILSSKSDRGGPPPESDEPAQTVVRIGPRTTAPPRNAPQPLEDDDEIPF